MTPDSGSEPPAEAPRTPRAGETGVVVKPVTQESPESLPDRLMSSSGSTASLQPGSVSDAMQDGPVSPKAGVFGGAMTRSSSASALPGPVETAVSERGREREGVSASVHRIGSAHTPLDTDDM
ncbi:hypothetical protein KIPB_012286, partial [Kipferlia bialata]|eukprot:g12286.t1